MLTQALDLGKQAGLKAFKIAKAIVVETIKLPGIYLHNILENIKQ